MNDLQWNHEPLWGTDDMLKCPVCKKLDTHVRGAYKKRAGPDFSVVVEGECGHWWEIEFRQNKGNTYVNYAPITDLVSAALSSAPQ